MTDYYDSEITRCTRCQIPRVTRAGSTPGPICRDCRAVLTPEERALWTTSTGPFTIDQLANLTAQRITHERQTA